MKGGPDIDISEAQGESDPDNCSHCEDGTCGPSGWTSGHTHYREDLLAHGIEEEVRSNGKLVGPPDYYELTSPGVSQ